MILDADRQEFAYAIESFCAKECGTLAQRDELIENETVANSPELPTKMAGLGWLGVSLPEEYGGAGAGFVDGDVAQAIDEGREENLALESAMAKMRATEVAKSAALEAMQLMGGAGYAREYGMEFQGRRALAPPILGGTNEIQREIIAKSLL